jgi:hypothetical protein
MGQSPGPRRYAMGLFKIIGGLARDGARSRAGSRSALFRFAEEVASQSAEQGRQAEAHRQVEAPGPMAREREVVRGEPDPRPPDVRPAWRFCPHCGGSLPPGGAFCCHCGTALSNGGAAAAPARPAPAAETGPVDFNFASRPIEQRGAPIAGMLTLIVMALVAYGLWQADLLLAPAALVRAVLDAVGAL